LSVPICYFNDFLSAIRPTAEQIEDMKKGHKTLRDRLNAFDDLKDIIVADFLQGSYKRSTAIRPKNGKRSDVDIIVVTNLDKEKCSPGKALKKFEPFVNKYYPGKWKYQGRSIGIELSYVDLDLVVTAAPSETQKGLLENTARDWATVFALQENISVTDFEMRVLESRVDPKWKSEPLWIPDRNAGKWEETDPLEQILWTQKKNVACNKNYINVVKAIKWWARINAPDTKPKGYPLEHVVGDNCPEGIQSVEEGLVRTLEAIVVNYQGHYDSYTKPVLADRGVPSHDVMNRITVEDFRDFYERVQNAAKLAKEAFDETDVSESAKKWRSLLGDKFPEPPKAKGFTSRNEISSVGQGRFSQIC
jgi:hypothetical protein